MNFSFESKKNKANEDAYCLESEIRVGLGDTLRNKIIPEVIARICYFSSSIFLTNEVGIPYESFAALTNQSVLFKIFPYTNIEYSTRLFEYHYLTKKITLPQLLGAAKNSDYNNETTNDVDELNEFHYFVDKDGLPLIYIDELSSNTLKIRILSSFYGRKLNGKEIPDVVELSFTKLNSSEVITIPPFNISNYNKSFWEKCGNSDYFWSKSALKNNASIISGGVDDDCLNLPNASSYAEFQKLLKKNTTLSFWVKPDDVTKTKQYIATKYKNQYGPYILSLETDKFTIEINNGSGVLQKVQSGKSIQKGVWNHICLSIDNDNLGILYINGVKDSKGTLNSVDYDAASKALLGTTEQAVDNGQTDKNFKGSIDEIIQFSSVITEGEVYQLYKWHLTN